MLEVIELALRSRLLLIPGRCCMQVHFLDNLLVGYDSEVQAQLLRHTTSRLQERNQVRYDVPDPASRKITLLPLIFPSTTVQQGRDVELT